MDETRKQMAELQPRIDEVELSLADVKSEHEKHRTVLTVPPKLWIKEMSANRNDQMDKRL